MRLRKRISAFILAFVMLFSLCACNNNSDGSKKDGKESEQAEKADIGDGVRFSDMVYERPETDAIRSSVDEICDMLDDGEDYDTVVEALDGFYELYWNFYTMATLAEIHSDLDTSDKYYSAEYEYCSAAEADVSTMFTELMVACASSDIADELDDDYFGGMLAEQYSGSYEDGFEKLNSLYAQESVLLNEYRNLLVKFYSCKSETQGYKTYNEDMCRIYIELVKLRHQIAKEYGFDSYEDLAYLQFGREYTPDDLKDYLAAIKEYIVPLYKEARDSGILDYAYYGLDEISAEDALSTVETTVSGMDKLLKEAMDFMLSRELYDVSASSKKLDTSYVIYIDDYSSPFLFVKPGGYQEDIITIAHEFGHFADSYENDDLDYNLDTSETLSQGMEYMLLSYLSDTKLAEALTEYKMTDILYLYVNQACFNEFEQRVFSLPENQLTVDKVNSIYAECANEYGFGEDFGDVAPLSWIDVSHFFDYPFYVVSYCVSDSAAFSMYCMEQNSAGSGLKAYLKVLRNAENFDFIRLLSRAGVSSPISADTVRSIADVISEKLDIG